MNARYPSDFSAFTPELVTIRADDPEIVEVPGSATFQIGEHISYYRKNGNVISLCHGVVLRIVDATHVEVIPKENRPLSVLPERRDADAPTVVE